MQMQVPLETRNSVGSLRTEVTDGWSHHVVAHAFIPSTREAEAGGSLCVRGQPGLQALVPGQRNPVFKKTTKKKF